MVGPKEGNNAMMATQEMVMAALAFVNLRTSLTRTVFNLTWRDNARHVRKGIFSALRVSAYQSTLYAQNTVRRMVLAHCAIKVMS